ncbi:unnamed protein product [Brassica rapa subsp. trilocularis]
MKSKEIYRVADLGLAICFTHSSVLSDLDHMCLPIDADRFGFNLHEVLKPTMDSGVTSICCSGFKAFCLYKFESKLIQVIYDFSWNTHHISTGLATVERDPSCQPITKTEFDIERRKVTKEAIMELISREITEYHTQLLMNSSFIYQKS